MRAIHPRAAGQVLANLVHRRSQLSGQREGDRFVVAGAVEQQDDAPPASSSCTLTWAALHTADERAA